MNEAKRKTEAVPAPPGVGDRRDLVYPWFAVLLAVIGFFAPLPFAEVGVNDDWSFALTARSVADTGRLAYNGWAAMPVGAQAYWGALFVRLFGFSFLALRLSTLVLSAGCAWLTYRTGRLWGLGPVAALFTTACLVLSPVYVPAAASFLTDIPSLFFWLLAVFCFTRAAIAGPADGRALLWLGAGAAASALGGTVRQIGWVPGLVVPPALALCWGRSGATPRGRLPVVWGVALGASAATAAVALLTTQWFRAQPYSVDPTQGMRWAGPADAVHLLSWLGTGISTLVLLLLPVVLYALFRSRAFRRPAAALGAVVGAALLYGAAVRQQSVPAGLHESLAEWWPYWGNALYSEGMYRGTYIGGWTWALPVGVRAALMVFVLAAAGVCLFLAAGGLAKAVRRLLTPGPGAPEPAVVVGLPLALGYVPVMLVRLLGGPALILFDRYLLPLLPLAAWSLLLHVRAHGAPAGDASGLAARAPRAAAGAALVLFAGYGIAATHDYFAASRARLEVLQRLEAAGVERTSVLAGLEPDAWAQIALTGYVDDPNIRVPPGEYGRHRVPPAIRGVYTFSRWFPSLRPEIMVVLGGAEGVLEPIEGTSVVFDTWLPPLVGRVQAYRVPPRLREDP